MQRTAAWLLMLVFAAQLLPLWPLPQDVAAKRIEFWSNAKAYWESTDPSMSETPEWTAKAKATNLSEISRALANTEGILLDARIDWGMCLLSALLALLAGLAAIGRSPHWRWLSIASLIVFLAVQEPWHFYRFFMLEGRIDLVRGLHQLALVAKDFPGVFSTMVLLSVVVPIVMASVATYAVVQLARRETKCALTPRC